MFQSSIHFSHENDQQSLQDVQREHAVLVANADTVAARHRDACLGSGSHRYGQAGVRESHGQSLARFLGDGFVDCDGDNQLNISAASGFVSNALGTADLPSVDSEYASVGSLDA